MMNSQITIRIITKVPPVYNPQCTVYTETEWVKDGQYACVCVYLHDRPCEDTQVELHQTCEDIFSMRGHQTRPRKFDLRLIPNYAHWFHSATDLGRKNLCALCVVVCVCMCVCVCVNKATKPYHAQWSASQSSSYWTALQASCDVWV